MRGNGLSADSYVAVADLDPGTADALLAALRDRGVAAYAAASPEPVPEGDTDRLYVDVAAVEQARALITVELSGSGPADDRIERLEIVDDGGLSLVGDDLDGTSDGGYGRDDADEDDTLRGIDLAAEFAAIVAGFHTAGPPDHPWPDVEDVPHNRRRTDTGHLPTDRSVSGRAQPSPPPDADPASPTDVVSSDDPVRGREGRDQADRSHDERGRAERAWGDRTRGAQDDGTPPAGDSPIGWEDLLRPLPVPEPEPEPGYVPPPPPPLPKASLGTRVAWAAVVGGPALLFIAVLLGWHLADWVLLAAAVSFLGGFVALVARLGEGPDDPDDDGAVV